jgi:hypothetical protein
VADDEYERLPAFHVGHEGPKLGLLMDQQMWRRIAQSAATRRGGRDYHRGNSPDGTWIAHAESGRRIKCCESIMKMLSVTFVRI